MQQFPRMMIICLLYRVIEIAVSAYPMGRIDDNSELKDERRYPNGTVVGTYMYKDKEGYPVHVRYFADDSSYGVELKSFKLVDPKLHQQQEKQQNIFAKFDDITNKSKIYTGFRLFDDNTQQVPKSDFEIYMENEIKPEKCGKEKVRVYYDKNNKRKIRNAFNPYETLCRGF